MKIKINGNFYDFFDEITVNYKLGSVASIFSFKGRFNPENKAHKLIFKPLAYNKVEIFSNDDELLFTGTSVNTSLSSNSLRDLQSISGYSKAGILEDCSIPYSGYPLEKIDVSLDDILSNILPFFDVGYLIDSSASNDTNLVYKKSIAQPSESVKSYISKLAAQRNIIISHDNKGDLVLFKPSFNEKPKLYLTKENSLSMSLKISGQALHSEISVIRQPSKDNTSIVPVDKSFNDLVGKKRSLVKVLSSGTETDTKKAADNAVASELSNISINVLLKRIEAVRVGDIVEVQNDEIYLYNRAKLVISEIIIKENSNSEEMSLSLVLPESFTGKTPKNIFL